MDEDYATLLFVAGWVFTLSMMVAHVTQVVLFGYDFGDGVVFWLVFLGILVQGIGGLSG